MGSQGGSVLKSPKVWLRKVSYEGYTVLTVLTAISQSFRVCGEQFL